MWTQNSSEGFGENKNCFGKWKHQTDATILSILFHLILLFERIIKWNKIFKIVALSWCLHLLKYDARNHETEIKNCFPITGFRMSGGISRCLVTIPTALSWRDWEVPRNFSFRTVSVAEEIRNGFLPNVIRKSYCLKQIVQLNRPFVQLNLLNIHLCHTGTWSKPRHSAQNSLVDIVYCTEGTMTSCLNNINLCCF